MKTYISILRGINVSGQKQIKMDALRELYVGLGFEKVVSYIQSGNVVFAFKEIEKSILELKISHEIEKVFGFDVRVVVLTVDDLNEIVLQNPFLHDSGKDESFGHVTFLSSKPALVDMNAIEAKKQGEEALSISDAAVYLYCPNGYGKTKLTNTFFELKLKIGATTRNWKTTKELLRIAQSY